MGRRLRAADRFVGSLAGTAVSRGLGRRGPGVSLAAVASPLGGLEGVSPHERGQGRNAPIAGAAMDR